MNIQHDRPARQRIDRERWDKAVDRALLIISAIAVILTAVAFAAKGMVG